MEYDRSSTSRSGERPVTRWRREQDSNDKQRYSPESPMSVKSYGKMERPTSRRGFKTDITEYGISRPPTSGRNVLSRPPSTGIMINRVPTAAPRINTSSSASLARTNSGVFRNFAQPNAKLLDRPVMQQGLAGIPTASSKGVPKLTRQIQDKRHYEQILQQKIRELNNEIEVITRQVEKENSEDRAQMDYDQKTNDFNVEFNKLQEQINEHYVAFNKTVLGSNKDEIMREVKELKEFNDREEVEMQKIFQKREQAEKRLSELNKEIESKRNVAEKMLGDMSLEMRSKYDELLKNKTDVQKEINVLQKYQAQLSDEKFKIQQKFVLSPMKQEAYKLYLKIVEGERKRDKVLEQLRNNSTVENKKINQENLDASSAEKQIIEIEKKIADAEEELLQLEINPDEIQTEKSVKHNEYHKQEEIMDIFRSSLVKSKAEELNRLSHLQEEIIEHLEQISNNVTESMDSNIFMSDETDMLKSLMNQNFNDRNDKSFEELKQDNNKLQLILNKLKSLETKINVEVNDYEGKAEVIYNETAKRDSIIYDFDKEQQKELSMLNDEPAIQKEKDNKLRQLIEENEIYRSISILEDKLERITIANGQIPQSNQEENELDKDDDYSSLQNKLYKLMARLTSRLLLGSSTNLLTGYKII
ncbi:PREDICTED: intraflagellar transport protein 74 homolog [Ceratosolen solmsi marchali]|uniref:Intraflagellar transport protein 74 homolog n=1 Tax=Ceratosolen solmsi marchali TaxID=326594 RepID=A0AAJ7E1T3_9HYME|nr:PREDICTED: intraflagellar transport protein 74 homolog [Ceratosolen solmsi marchali]